MVGFAAKYAAFSSSENVLQAPGRWADQNPRVFSRLRALISSDCMYCFLFLDDNLRVDKNQSLFKSNCGGFAAAFATINMGILNDYAGTINPKNAIGERFMLSDSARCSTLQFVMSGEIISPKRQCEPA